MKDRGTTAPRIELLPRTGIFESFSVRIDQHKINTPCVNANACNWMIDLRKTEANLQQDVVDVPAKVAIRKLEFIEKERETWSVLLVVAAPPSPLVDIN